MTKGLWDTNGEPVNLEAASSDALVWLRMYHALATRLRLATDDVQKENLVRLGNCIEKLEGLLSGINQTGDKERQS